MCKIHWRSVEHLRAPSSVKIEQHVIKWRVKRMNNSPSLSPHFILDSNKQKWIRSAGFIPAKELKIYFLILIAGFSRRFNTGGRWWWIRQSKKDGVLFDNFHGALLILGWMGGGGGGKGGEEGGYFIHSWLIHLVRRLFLRKQHAMSPEKNISSEEGGGRGKEVGGGGGVIARVNPCLVSAPCSSIRGSFSLVSSLIAFGRARWNSSLIN